MTAQRDFRLGNSLLMCNIDTATRFEGTKEVLENSFIPLRFSIEEGAPYYAPKDEIEKIDVFLADILEALDKDKNVFLKWYERLSGFCDRRFGPNWKDNDPEFRNSLLKYQGWTFLRDVEPERPVIRPGSVIRLLRWP
jgi:hypothetical protein